jgi:hypothetical protein
VVECADLLDLPPVREQLEKYPTIDFREDGIWFEVERTTIPRNGRPSPGYVITWCEHTGNEDCTAQMRFIFDRVGTVGICRIGEKGKLARFCCAAHERNVEAAFRIQPVQRQILLPSIQR